MSTKRMQYGKVFISHSSVNKPFVRKLVKAIEARDPLVFFAVPAILSLVALLAVWLPAMRARKVDPVVALRYE